MADTYGNLTPGDPRPCDEPKNSLNVNKPCPPRPTPQPAIGPRNPRQGGL
jgi:hypothetical protein